MSTPKHASTIVGYDTMSLAEARAYAHLINVALGVGTAALAYRKRLAHGTHAVTEVTWDDGSTAMLENAPEVFDMLRYIMEQGMADR